jgi:DNA uptake protein ComE-like DNA-binding protein
MSAIVAAALLSFINLSIAAEGKPATSTETQASPAASSKGTKAKGSEPKVKPVDINSASKAELKKLKGVDDALADKIIAGRPYLSKAHLVTRNIMPHGVYEQNKKRIVAIQKTAANKK